MCERVGGGHLDGASRRRLGLSVRKRSRLRSVCLWEEGAIVLCALSFTLRHCSQNTKRSDEILAISIDKTMLCKPSRKDSVYPTRPGKVWAVFL